MTFAAACPMLWFLGAGMLLTSCQDAPSESGQVRQRVVSTPAVAAAPLATPGRRATRSAAPRATSPTSPEPVATWYRFEDDTLRQTLRVVQLSARRIRFRLVDSLKTTGQCRQLAGTATAPAGDPEIDEGEDGTAYPAVAYHYQGACFLSVRIELATRQRAQLVSDNCHTAHADGTFQHGGILHRMPGGK